MNWNIEDFNGYKPKTSFWRDFTIADHYGINAIEDTFNRAFNEWKNNYIYLTELVMVLNWKLWYYYDKDSQLAKLYDKIWRQADEYACENLKGEELDYFYSTTD